MELDITVTSMEGREVKILTCMLWNPLPTTETQNRGHCRTPPATGEHRRTPWERNAISSLPAGSAIRTLARGHSRTEGRRHCRLHTSINTSYFKNADTNKFHIFLCRRSTILPTPQCRRGLVREVGRQECLVKKKHKQTRKAP